MACIFPGDQAGEFKRIGSGLDTCGRMDLDFEMTCTSEPVGAGLKDVELCAFDIDLGEVGVIKTGFAEN